MTLLLCSLVEPGNTLHVRRSRHVQMRLICGHGVIAAKGTDLAEVVHANQAASRGSRRRNQQATKYSQETPGTAVRVAIGRLIEAWLSEVLKKKSRSDRGRTYISTELTRTWDRDGCAKIPTPNFLGLCARVTSKHRSTRSPASSA